MFEIVDGRPIFREIKTEDDAHRFLTDLIVQVVTARIACNVEIPGDPVTTAKRQRVAWTNYRIRYGQALGALTTLMHVRKLSDVAYNHFNQQIQATAAETVAGGIQA